MFEKLWLAAVLTLLANGAYMAQTIPIGAEVPATEPAYLLTQERN
ncbi:hypothetical protein [Trichothermofontia sp.]